GNSWAALRDGLERARIGPASRGADGRRRGPLAGRKGARTARGVRPPAARTHPPHFRRRGGAVGDGGSTAPAGIPQHAAEHGGPRAAGARLRLGRELDGAGARVVKPPVSRSLLIVAGLAVLATLAVAGPAQEAHRLPPLS